MIENAEKLAEAVSNQGSGPLWVHSDLLAARSFVPPSSGRDELLRNHQQVLNAISGDRDLWTVCFNYDFTRSGFADLRELPSEVGPLGDYARKQAGAWRTLDPVFSICGAGTPACAVSDTADAGEPRRMTAFGDQTAFAELYRQDGTLLFYGAPFSSATHIHFAELQAGGPLYRYDKVFSGTVVDNDGASHLLDYVYHVRPRNMHFDYAWPRLLSDVQAAGLFSEIRSGDHVVARVIRVRGLVGFWVEALQSDPFYLLDARSREWVSKRYDQLKRRFQISDFE